MLDDGDMLLVVVGVEAAAAGVEVEGSTAFDGVGGGAEEVEVVAFVEGMGLVVDVEPVVFSLICISHAPKTSMKFSVR